MLQKLESIKDKYEKLLTSLSDPAVVSDPKQIRRISKEKSDLDPIIKKYDEYRKVVAGIAESKEILDSLSSRFGKLVLDPIYKSADLAYAHSAHMDIFNFRPPRKREDGALRSSSRGTQDYARLVEVVIKRTKTKALKV